MLPDPILQSIPDKNRINELFVKKIEIDEEGYIRIYDITTSEEVVRYLYSNGIVINEIKMDRVGLEEYYIDLMKEGER